MMANFTQDAVISLTAEEISMQVKMNHIGVFSGVVLATMVTYDASEYSIFSISFRASLRVL